MKKTKLPSIKTMRNKCDALMTPIAKKMSPTCIFCKNQTQVGHHHIHKSKSTTLRYEPSNIIPLCNGCHFKLHQNESYWACKIMLIKGIEWFKLLDKQSKKEIKTDIHYYIQAYEELKLILDIF